MISASALLLVLRRFYHVGRHVHMNMISALARIHDQCFCTPASVLTLLLRWQARLCFVPYCTFGYILYRVSFILYTCVSVTSESHNFLVRTPIRVFLDSMEIPLSQLSIRMPLEGSGFLSRPEMAVRASKVGCPGETA